MVKVRVKNILYIVVAVLVILSIPLIAMQFSDEVVWTLSDFFIMGFLLLGTGLVYEFATMNAKNAKYKVAMAIAVLSSLILIWMNLAVGIIGEDNPINLLYFLVVLIGLIGAIIVRFNSTGMSKTMFTMAVAQFLVPFVAMVIKNPDMSPGVLGVIALSAFFAVLFFVSGLLFKQARNKK